MALFNELYDLTSGGTSGVQQMSKTPVGQFAVLNVSTTAGMRV